MAKGDDQEVEFSFREKQSTSSAKKTKDGLQKFSPSKGIDKTLNE